MPVYLPLFPSVILKPGRACSSTHGAADTMLRTSRIRTVFRELKHLLIVYHSQSGHTRTMADAVRRGARSSDIEGVETRMLCAAEAGPRDLLWADALLLGTPENFGYMSGAMKDFLDRTFYACQGKVESLPYAVFICAGNDGSGALSSIRRIARGYPLREVQEAIVRKGEPDREVLARCEDLGTALAAGLELGVY